MVFILMVIKLLAVPHCGNQSLISRILILVLILIIKIHLSPPGELVDPIFTNNLYSLMNPSIQLLVFIIGTTGDYLVGCKACVAI